jgi:hypothetical protein
LQIGAAQVLLETQDSLNFSISQHCYEYCNTLGWFYDSFEHPQRLKLLYVAASFLNRNAWHQRILAMEGPHVAELPAGAERMSELQLLERTLAAIVALDGPQAVAWAKAYLASSATAKRCATVGADRLPPWQRPAQPGDRSMPTRGLREKPQFRPRPVAACVRAAYRRAQEVRRFS